MLNLFCIIIVCSVLISVSFQFPGHYLHLCFVGVGGNTILRWRNKLTWKKTNVNYYEFEFALLLFSLDWVSSVFLSANYQSYTEHSNSDSVTANNTVSLGETDL